jgi:uncharacterized protein (TIGR04562 family)
MAFLKRYDFRWETFDIVVSGRSTIDASEGFQLRNLDDVGRFALSYGYDLENPIETAEVFGNFQEALNFIRKNFLQPENPDGLKLDIPRKILELTDVRELFLMASLSYPSQNNDTQGLLLRNLACSLLKVMHTIAHIDKDLRTPYFAECQKQIFDRFYRVIHRDDEGKLFMGDRAEDPDRIDLVAFETKPKKARDSTLLKLLHKPENVAEDIFDQVGIRFVTHTPMDALRVIKFLKDRMILMPPNIKPSRSRNTLVDMESFRKGWEEVFRRWERHEVTNGEVAEELEQLAHYPDCDPDNPHSSKFYRAIQFTCRQLIKFKNPVHDDLRDVRQLARQIEGGAETVKALLDRIDRIDLKKTPRELRFFYPYEVQLMDLQSYEENERGKSAHSEYKKAQVQTAMRRVMGSLADAARV